MATKQEVLDKMDELISLANETTSEADTEFTSAIGHLVDGYGKGSEPIIEPLEITENGTYQVGEGVDGYNPITVNVSGGSGDCELISIAIDSQPKKRAYNAGETFDPSGMVVNASFRLSVDGKIANTVEEVTNYTFSPSGELSVNDSSVEVEYTYNGVTKKASVNITVVGTTVKPILANNFRNNITNYQNITSIVFIPNYTSETYDSIFDASANNDGGLIGYVKGTDVVITWDNSEYKHIELKNCESMFFNCSALTSLDFSNFDTSNIYDMTQMFRGCSSLTSLDFSNFNTSNVTSMNGMFNGCSALTSLDFSNFDTSKVKNMTSVFSGCSALTSLDVSNFNTSNVVGMGSMFFNCSALTSLDISNFNTSNVDNMASMFRGCSALTSLDFSNFDTSKVTDFRFMFRGCSALTSLDISNFNTSNVNYMSSMFSECSSLTDLTIPSTNGNGLANTETTMYGKSTNVYYTVSASGRTVHVGK